MAHVFKREIKEFPIEITNFNLLLICYYCYCLKTVAVIHSVTSLRGRCAGLGSFREGACSQASDSVMQTFR